MADRLGSLSDRELGAALVAVGRDLAFPEVSDLAPAVVRRLEERPVRGPVLERAAQILGFPVFRRPGRRVALALAAVLILAGGAVAGGLLVRGVRILIAPERTSPPEPLGSRLFLGDSATLVEAERMVNFDVLTVPGLGNPNVFVHDDPPGGRVSLVYPTGPGLPETEETGVGMLIMQFRARIDLPFLEKVVHEAELVEEVEVGGEAAYWIEGQHTLFYLDEQGQPLEQRSRLAGSTLLWQRGDVTFRLEAALSMEDAIRIAESMR